MLQKTLRVYDNDIVFHDLDVGLAEFGGERASAPVGRTMVQAAVSDEADILGELFNFIREVNKFRAMGFLHYSLSIPGQFALLVSDKEEHVALGLEHARAAWHALSNCEQRAKNSAPERELLETVAFQNWLWPRETLLALAQWGFRWVPPTGSGDDRHPLRRLRPLDRRRELRQPVEGPVPGLEGFEAQPREAHVLAAGEEDHLLLVPSARVADRGRVAHA